ncbi:MAG: HAD-IA family hydrolase [Pseudomonadota bacterium]
MKALLFGSIGSIVETSELQRLAFNEAFHQHGLNWDWDRPFYASMLGASGGAARIAQYSILQQEKVDAKAIHATKTAIFQETLRTTPPSARPGVLDTIKFAKWLGLTLGFISTTAHATIETILENVEGLSPDTFDIVTSADIGLLPKPSPEIYTHTLFKLGLSPKEALAIEDNEAGLWSAKSAGIPTVSFFGALTSEQDSMISNWRADGDVFPVIQAAVNSALETRERQVA